MSDTKGYNSFKNISVSYALHQGTERKYMEDRIVITDFTSDKKHYVLIAVLDGHGSSEVVDYVKDNLKKVLQQMLKTSKNMRDAIENSFHVLNSSTKELQGGTTASLLLIQGQKGVMANVGDSSVYGVSEIEKDSVISNKVFMMSRDHNVNKKKERKRVETYKDNYIEDGYVGKGDSLLAVTRAIGDHDLGDVIIVKPWFKDFDTSRLKYIIMASDGVWDVMNGKEVWSQVQKYMSPWKNSADQVLVKRNLAFSQHDNTALILVKFNTK